MKRRLKIFSIVGVFLLLVSGLVVLLNTAEAGLDIITIELLDSSSNHVYTQSTVVETTQIVFDPETAINTQDGIEIEFAAGVTVTCASIDGDVAVTQAGGNPTIGTVTCTGQYIRIPIGTEGAAPGGQVTVTIDSSTNTHITTPASDGTFKVTARTWDLDTYPTFAGAGTDILEDEGSGAFLIGTNQVDISGTVDPTLTLALSANTCDLGTLSATKIATCSYDATVSTNATNGYSAYIREGAGLLNAALDEITEVADTDVTPAGTSGSTDEEYGVSTSKSGQTISENTTGETCADLDIGGGEDGLTAMPATALTGSDKQFASASAPASSDATTICHAAAIIGSTPAGVYAHTVTITVVGNF